MTPNTEPMAIGQQDDRDVVDVVGDERDDDRQQRAERADQVAATGSARMRETLEREDEADGGDEVGDLRPRVESTSRVLGDREEPAWP